MTKLVVITGAGASHDCSTQGFRPGLPPLVANLFSTNYDPILARYPLALQAAADIRQATQGDEDAVPLERFLRERMRDSANPYTQRRYRQVPLYLQELLSQQTTANPDNYNALLNAALELDHVLFLTLNYDTILDDCLSAYSPRADDMSWYIDTDDRWSLVKLHGSIDWAFPLLLDASVNFAQTIEWANTLLDGFAEMPQMDPEDIVLRRAPRNVAAMRLGGGTGSGDDRHLYYPALAVPLGEEDELVCPTSHADNARRHLAEDDGLNLLVIGYSGVDREVLKLLHESGNGLRRLLIVNGGDTKSALQAGERITGALGAELREESITDLTFGRFVATGTLRRWFDSLD